MQKEPGTIFPSEPASNRRLNPLWYPALGALENFTTALFLPVFSSLTETNDGLSVLFLLEAN